MFDLQPFYFSILFSVALREVFRTSLFKICARFINSWFESSLGTKRICFLIKKLTGYYPMSFM
jgi:hypothetical protein